MVAERGEKMIRITDKYGILVDSDNYTLVRLGVILTGKNAGEETTNTLGYYSSLDNAIYAALDKIERDELGKDDVDLGAAVTIVRRLHRDMKDYLKKVLAHES